MGGVCVEWRKNAPRHRGAPEKWADCGPLPHENVVRALGRSPRASKNLIIRGSLLSFVPHDLMYGPQAKLIAECFTPRIGKHEGKIDIRGRLLRHPSQRRQNDCDGARDHRAAQLRGVICSDNVRVAMPIVAIGRLPRLGRTCVGALTHLLRRVCPLVREILAGVSHFLRSV